MTVRKPAFWPTALAVAVLSGTFWAGATLPTQPVANAGVRETTPKQHFLSGGERALPILSEMSATLKQIDTRLAKIEKTIENAARK